LSKQFHMGPFRFITARYLRLRLLLFLLLFFPSGVHAELPSAGAASPTITIHFYFPLVARSLTSGNWLGYVNYYRTMASLPLLLEDSTLSEAGWLHARYIVKNDVLGHSEDPQNPWYTPEGAAAAQSSNLSASYNAGSSDESAVDVWMQAPFHAIGILDPALHHTGFGSYREADGGLQMGAALDVIRGLGEVPASVGFPIQWPADGETVPISLHWGESPNPLTSCPGYTAPAGLPILLQVGPGGLVPDVTSTSFTQSSTALEHCTFDETSYANPDSSLQSLGRSILATRDAIVLIPRAPLMPGTTYTVSVTVDGQNYVWSFTVASTVQMRGVLEGPVP